MPPLGNMPSNMEMPPSQNFGQMGNLDDLTGRYGRQGGFRP
jgi:hypothetical protein